MVLLLIIVFLAAVGGLIGYKLKLPVGGMLGAIVAVAVFQLTTQQSINLPPAYQIGMMLAFGPLIGGRVAKKDLIELKKLAFPAVVMVFCMLGFNIIFGIIMFRVSDLDITTALFATAPGGMVDMAIISLAFGANYVYVILLQMTRNLAIVAFILPFYKKIMTKMTTKKAAMPPCTTVKLHSTPQLVSDTNQLPTETMPFYKQAKYFGQTLLCSSALGLILWWANIPAGALIGAMIGAAVFNVLTSKAYFFPSLRLPLQIGVGLYIGLRIDRQSVAAIGEVIVPAIIVLLCVIAITCVTSFVVHKLTGLDPFTSLVASTPGGMAEMSMLADDLGIDAPKVAVLHLTRLMSVIVLFPIVLSFVIRLFR